LARSKINPKHNQVANCEFIPFHGSKEINAWKRYDIIVWFKRISYSEVEDCHVHERPGGEDDRNWALLTCDKEVINLLPRSLVWAITETSTIQKKKYFGSIFSDFRDFFTIFVSFWKYHVQLSTAKANENDGIHSISKLKYDTQIFQPSTTNADENDDISFDSIARLISSFENEDKVNSCLPIYFFSVSPSGLVSHQKWAILMLFMWVIKGCCDNELDFALWWIIDCGGAMTSNFFRVYLVLYEKVILSKSERGSIQVLWPIANDYPSRDQA
jgi:hypothetical protein